MKNKTIEQEKKSWLNFSAFIDWYAKIGGNPLNEQQIEKVYIKF